MSNLNETLKGEKAETQTPRPTNEDKFMMEGFEMYDSEGNKVDLSKYGINRKKPKEKSED